jgi:pilus assembly protein Flp/PilA
LLGCFPESNRHQEAYDWAERAYQEGSDHSLPVQLLAASAAMVENLALARILFQRIGIGDLGGRRAAADHCPRRGLFSICGLREADQIYASSLSKKDQAHAAKFNYGTLCPVHARSRSRRLNRTLRPSPPYDLASQGQQMIELVLAFLTEESGSTAIEYALIAAGIALAILTAVNTVGTALNNMFTSISTALK